MEEIIIALIIIGAGYYLITHQTKPKVNHSPIIHTNSQATQTEPLTNPTNPDNQDLEKTLDNLILNIRQLNQQIK